MATFPHFFHTSRNFVLERKKRNICVAGEGAKKRGRKRDEDTRRRGEEGQGDDLSHSLFDRGGGRKEGRKRRPANGGRIDTTVTRRGKESRGKFELFFLSLSPPRRFEIDACEQNRAS